jgi:hypothetical protein
MRLGFFSVPLPEVDVTYPIKAIAASIATLFTLENFPFALNDLMPFYWDEDIHNVMPKKDDDALDLNLNNIR